MPRGLAAPARKPRPRWSWTGSSHLLLRVLCVGSATALLLAAVAEALAAMRSFDGIAADGPFQLYNALRRMDDGQLPGQDYVFFHGPGVPYVHYPLYVLLGRDLFAAEASRQLLSPFVLVGTTVAFCRVLTNSWRTAVPFAGGLIALMHVAGMRAVIDPGNSLLGIRSTAPVVLAALLLWLHGRGRTGWAADAAAAGALALGLVLGTEQGMALLAGHSLVLLTLGSGDWKQRAVAVARRGVIAGLVALSVLCLMSGGPAAALNSLRYNVVDVAHDQFWYFGSPPNPYIATLGELLGEWRVVVPVIMAILLLVVIRGLVAHGALERPTAVALGTLPAYGLISVVSYLGIATPGNAQPCMRAVLLCAAGLAWAFWADRRWAAARLVGAAPSQAVPEVRRTLLSGLGVVTAMSLVISTPVADLRDVRADAAGLRDEGRSLDDAWTAFSARTADLVGRRSCRTSETSHLWSTYAGLTEAERSCFHPHTDYVIHALGPERREEYIEAFRRHQPEFVQVVRRSYFPYEDWLRLTTWEFYETLFTDYQPLGLTAHSVFWRRSEPSEPNLVLGPEREAPVAGGDSTVVVPVSPHAQLVVLHLDYEVSNPLRAVPVAGALPRHLVEVSPQLLQTTRALDPALTSASVPVFVPAGTTSVGVRLETRSLTPGADADLRRVRYSEGRFPEGSAWAEAVFE